ncbi:hypothetical protein [Aureimonas ureilytica]|uniref:hypothetical protein n=1 Tax=Aureimonas ureilytica TaxID=401562 RepID=UPI00036350AA|nr:hypothetical protein [Aureimonas ureilytica]
MRQPIGLFSLGAMLALAALPAMAAEPMPAAKPDAASAGALWPVAENLVAAELALGIAPEQRPQWRAFVEAALRLAEIGPDRGDLAPAGVPRLKLLLEIETRKGEAAAELARALDALVAVLSPAQRQRADRLLAALPAPLGGSAAPLGGSAAPLGGGSADHRPEAAPSPPASSAAAVPSAPAPGTPPTPEASDGTAQPRFDKPSLFTR